MLVRIVRLTFEPDAVEQFLDLFDDTAPKIRDFAGCRHLELWRDRDAPHVCTTYSHWKSKEALDQYRNSRLFQETWSTVTSWFADRPEAHSYSVIRPADDIESAFSASPTDVD